MTFPLLTTIALADFQPDTFKSSNATSESMKIGEAEVDWESLIVTSDNVTPLLCSTYMSAVFPSKVVPDTVTLLLPIIEIPAQ